MDMPMDAELIVNTVGEYYRLVGSVLSNLLKIKESLTNDERWIGKNYGNGLWGDVVRMVEVITNSFAGVPADMSGFW
jgi:hypothetical protein